MPTVREQPPYLLDPFYRAAAYLIRHNAAQAYPLPRQLREMEASLARYWERKAREAGQHEN